MKEVEQEAVLKEFVEQHNLVHILVDLKEHKYLEVHAIIIPIVRLAHLDWVEKDMVAMAVEVGGGWYGGGGTHGAGAGGGSGYVYTSSTASNYPSGCLLNSSCYLTNAQTISGTQSFPAPTNSSNETGHSGDGAAKITPVN